RHFGALSSSTTLGLLCASLQPSLKLRRQRCSDPETLPVAASLHAASHTTTSLLWPTAPEGTATTTLGARGFFHQAVKMNTVKSFWLGWGSLCVAGAGAYYFAKKEINADRKAKLEEARRKKYDIRSLEYSGGQTSTATAATANGTPARTDSAGSPSQEASNDPAPTRHAPATESERVAEKSKYESDTPYRSRKGDRFS
ncbi:hypothetical protein ACCO45_007271, partial [Purpureocillium lilacinum]